MNLVNRPLAGEVTNSSCSNTTNGLINLENDHLELQTIKAQKSSVHDRMIDENDDQGDHVLVVRAENDLSTELNVSWAGSSSTSCCSSPTSVSLTLYEPAGNTTATETATNRHSSNSLHFLLH